MKIEVVFLFLLTLLLTISSAGAEEERPLSQVSYFNMAAGDNLIISGVTVNSLNMGSTQHFTLNSFGQIYYLDVVSEKSWGYNTFTITETDPYGSVSTKTISKFNPFTQSYGLHLQFFTSGIGEMVNAYLGVDIYLGLSPLRAQFDHLSPGNLSQGIGELEYNPIGFSNVIFDSTSSGNAIVYVRTAEEWKDVVDNDWWAQLTGSIGSWVGSGTDILKSLFSWTWDLVLTTFERIPYIGPSITGILILTAFLANETIFYATLLLQNWDTVFLIIEAFIGLDALKAKSIDGVFRKLVKNNILLIEKTIDYGSKVIRTFSGIISAIAQLISSIKPL